MTKKESWDKIEALIEQALQLPADKRTEFLKKECGADTKLFREIESLLSFDEESEKVIGNIQQNVVPFAMSGLLQDLKNITHLHDPVMTGRNVAHYQIMEKLGSGGMGTVYKARDTKLDRFVALKFLNPRGYTQEAPKETLIAEAKASASLNHPNIATIYEINEDASQIFIVMEFIDGITLRTKMKQTEIRLNTALEYAAGIAEALAEAHEYGVIHGDIKPENIMIDSNNRVKVADFGLAKLRNTTTNKSLTAGTPEYMAPERIRGEETDQRSDLWSLGVIFHEMFYGSRPFIGDNEASLFQTILQNEPGIPARRPDSVPNEVRDVIDKLLQKNPDNRFRDASELLKTCSKLFSKNRQQHQNGQKKVEPVFAVPYPLTDFIGRGRELAELKKLLHTKRLITLTGVAGSGKTRLSIQLAHKSRDIINGGIIFFDLSTIRDSGQVLAFIARTLNLKEKQGKTIVDMVRDYLQNHALTLILDNFEQVLDAAPAIADLLFHAPQCRMIVTSREPLNIQGEAVFSVPPLSLPGRSVTLDENTVSRYESVKLFTERAKLVRPDFEISSENIHHITGICRRLDGLPLAIELAAVRIKFLSPKTLLTRLNDRFNLLTGGTGDLPARQRSLRTAIEWSYDLLSTDEQTLFRRLAIFAGGFTLNAAEEICRIIPEFDTNIEDGISSLLDKNLLYITRKSDDSQRFEMLESIREFALERLSQSGEFVALRDSHRNYFARYCQKILPEMTGSGLLSRIDEIDNDYENLIRALEWKSGLESQVKNSLIICNVLWRFWLRKCLFSEGRHRIREILLSADINQNSDLIAEVMLGAGTLAHNNGDYNEALEQISKSHELYRNSENKEGIAKALTNLGWVHWRRGEYRQARSLSEEALDFQKQRSDQSSMALALNNLGWIAHHQGEFIRALQYHKKSLGLHRKLGDKRNIAFSLSNSAWASLKLGNYSEAESLFNEALILFSEVDERQLKTFTLSLKAELMSHTGRTDEALTQLNEEILPLFRDIEDTYGYALSMNCLGMIHFRKKQFSDAVKYIEESKTLREDLGDRWGVAQAQCSLARTLIHSGNRVNAGKLLLNSYSIRRNLDDKHGLSEVLEGLAEYFFHSDSKETALKFYRLSVQLRKQIETPQPPEKETIICQINEFDKQNPDDFYMISDLSVSSRGTINKLLRVSDNIISNSL